MTAEKDNGKSAPPTDDFDLEPSALKKLQPGDVLDVVRKLRTLMAAYETASFSLYASFTELGGAELELEAAKARHTLELASGRIATLLATLEKTPNYQGLRQEVFARRTDKRSRDHKDHVGLHTQEKKK